jgi:gamma-glutamyltranspeptidase / glutathione hydrolase
MGGVVAAGHQVTAEAAADVLRAGGNAVDAAVAAVLMSFVAESPLTGPGAGGFMLVHTAGGEDHLLDFFVAAPGLGLSDPSPAELEPAEIRFSDDAVQLFHIGASSCGAYGTPLGLAEALERFGTVPLATLAERPARDARDGIEVSTMQAFLFQVLAPILTATGEGRAIYAPRGRLLEAGERIHLPDLGGLLERLGDEGPGFLYTGDAAAAASDWVLERGGILTREDLAHYRVDERTPARARYRGREVLTNPPPSSGGILIAYALDLLERLPLPATERDAARALVGVMERTNRERTDEFASQLHSEGYLERLLAKEAMESAATEVRGRLGSTTHVSVLDDTGSCASVTCSNGSCSGVVVPGTGLHLNNMLGEEDLNPLGHRHEPGRRIPSMMAPTVVLGSGRPELALGSAGSNRIRSAILQTIVGVVDGGLTAEEAVRRDRLHFEGGMVDAEPGIDVEALEDLRGEGFGVQRWRERNLFFGGVQAVARDASTGELSGGGDPRRGGVALLVE